jgi:hypothetical protein
MTILQCGQMGEEVELYSPELYMEYIRSFDLDVVSIISVEDNGFGYDWFITYNNGTQDKIMAFEPIAMLQWLLPNSDIKIRD